MAKNKAAKKLELNVSHPGDVADGYLKAWRHIESRMLTLLRYNETWLTWKDGAYAEQSDEYFRAMARRWLEKQELFKFDKYGELVPAICSIRYVTEMLDAILARTMTRAEETGFFWLKPERAKTEASAIVSFKNGLLDTTTMRLEGHTPNWFSYNTLPYDYDTTATCENWLSWLDMTSGGDADWINCLQLWFGYNMVADTSKQRYALFFGPPRSGKGTATRILMSLLGDWNCSSPTLTQLGSNQFALGAMVGKLAALVPDVAIGRFVDTKVVMEILSAITGEDAMDVVQKYKPTLNSVKMKTRFTISSNEPIKWPDATNKLSKRCIVFPFSNSFAGKEDSTIEQGLMDEIAGIANWALAGLKKLAKLKDLPEPKCGAAKHQLFSDLDSPLALFCRTCIKEDATKRIAVYAMHDMWMAWSKEEGRLTKGQTRVYIKSLILNAFPHILVEKKGSRGAQEYHYIGLDVTEDGKKFIHMAAKRKRTVKKFAGAMKIKL